jgi:hypothetical protein
MNNLTIALVVVIAALGGFYGGAKVEQGKVPAAAASPVLPAGGGAGGAGGAGATGGTGGTGGGGFGGFARGTAGQVTAISGNTLTITTAAGQQVKVQLSDTTTITKTVQGSRTDLQQGATVTVAGQRAADGSVTATSVTILPAGTTLPAGGGGGGGNG